MAARHEEGCYEKQCIHVLSCFAKKGLSNDAVGVARGTAFQEIRPGAGFKTGNLVEESWGGGYRRTTVERLVHGNQDKYGFEKWAIYRFLCTP